MDLLCAYDLQLHKTAVFQNAFGIQEEKELNNIYHLTFQIPANDPKLQYLQGFHYIRSGDYGQTYRIVKVERSGSDKTISRVTCEHVIATLCDNVLFGSFIYGGSGIYTADVIRWLLSRQTMENWILGECDFNLEYEYSWEQENLLNALYSIPKEFVDPYMWDFDTISYPWTINLKRIHTDAAPQYYIQAGSNILDQSRSQDYTNVCTRLYPLGYGEGINQLTIRSANNDIPYLEATSEEITHYGIKEKVLVDRSFENAESLKAYAETAFSAIRQPGFSRSFDVVDLYPITSKEIDQAEIGKICCMTEDNTKAYITRTVRVLDDPGNLQIELSTKTDNVINTIADLADRIRIESVYAQGATQIYQHSKDANAGPTVAKGHVISLYFPSEMKQINKVMLRLKLKKFRSYSATTENGGSSSQTSGGGGGYASTDACEINGGNISYTINTNWEPSTEYIPTLYNTFNNDGYHNHTIARNWFMHSHTISSSGSQSHQHKITLPDHNHSVIIPGHSHNIIAGIYENSEVPTGFSVYIRNTLRTTVQATTYEADITQWLLNDHNLIPRNQWIDVVIVPDKLAYVVSSVFVQGFVQSRGGGNY